ncbi:unnamed protein product [Lactuca saligna]|uniref:Uncharacterized protein n=1 Tax=Lactuca saligna TaxID=75948 RepID=A0AA35Y261_LACSI|nr:unnamed protein product [Lactuca saligna]
MRPTEGVSGVDQPPDGIDDAATRREMKRGEGVSNPLSTVAAATTERNLSWSQLIAPSSTATTQWQLEVRTRQHPKIARYPLLVFSISGHGLYFSEIWDKEPVCPGHHLEGSGYKGMFSIMMKKALCGCDLECLYRCEGRASYGVLKL